MIKAEMISKTNFRIIATGLILPLTALLISCSGGEATGNSRSGVEISDTGTTPAPKLIELLEPEANKTLHSGELLNVVVGITGKEPPDSVRFYFDGVHRETVTSEPWTLKIETGDSRLGNIPVKVVAYLGQGRPQTVARFVTLFSDIVPPVQRYQVTATYPHDIEAYTQGLLVLNGFFLESTGEYGKSNLRQVEISTGKVIKQHNLESKFFGEGLALLGEKLYQLTWLTNIGFVYDVNSFTLIESFHYDTQGWGLTSDGEKLIMSDGSNKIYFLEPQYFTVLSSIEVYDNKTAVWQLNELEYINGELWANIYQTDRIARIDPATGKVIAYIDLTGLLAEKERHPNIDFLNGIAWEEETGRIFVTGKKWPKLYEIKITR